MSVSQSRGRSRRWEKHHWDSWASSSSGPAAARTLLVDLLIHDFIHAIIIAARHERHLELPLESPHAQGVFQTMIFGASGYNQAVSPAGLKIRTW